MILNKAVLKKYPDLNNLDEIAKKSLGEDEISLKTALVLFELPVQERKMFLETIKKYRLGVNKQQEFIKLAIDIKKRDNLPLEELIAGIEKEIEQKNLEGKKQGNYLILKLREKRYPLVSEFKKKLEEKKNFLKNKGFNLVLPASLEEEGYIIEIHFKDREDLQKKIHNLKTLTEKMEL